MGKSVTDFGKIRHRLCENEPPTLGKSVTDFWKRRLGFWDKQASFLKKNISVFGKTENWLVFFWIGLGQSSSLTVLNVEHVWVGVLEVLGLGVSKNKSTGRRVNC